MTGEIQVLHCENCGTQWIIERHCETSDIVAGIWKCPLCDSLKRTEITERMEVTA